MPLRKISFKYEDGVPPTRIGEARVLSFRLPFPMNIQPGQVSTVNLGLSCDTPLFLFEAKPLRDRGIVVSLLGAVDALTPIIVKIDNQSGQLQVMDYGDSVCRGVPLTAYDTEI